MNYFVKFKGQAGAKPACPPWSELAFIGLGGFLAICAIGGLAAYTGQPLIMGSFGASCFILFVVPASPYAQPRNVIGGHLVSSLMGLVFLHFVGPEWWSMALALASALVLMLILGVSHPPAASNPLIVFLASPGWAFLLMPTLIGACVLVLVALFYLNLSSTRQYPVYWA